MKKSIWCFLSAVLMMSLFVGWPTVDAAQEEDSIDINTASVEILTSLPKIGPKTAEEIVRYRSEHGPFRSVDEIRQVKGIGEKKFLLLKDKITVGNAKGVQPRGTMPTKKR